MSVCHQCARPSDVLVSTESVVTFDMRGVWPKRGRVPVVERAVRLCLDCAVHR